VVELVAGLLAGAAVALLMGWALWARPLVAARTAVEAERGRADALQKDALRLTGENERAKGVVDGLRLQLDEAKAAASLVPGLQADVARLDATQIERDAAHAAAITGLREEFARVAGEALATAQAGFAAQAAETLAAHREAATANLTANKADLAGLLTPVAETLKRYQLDLKAVEQDRLNAYGGLMQELAGVAQGQQAVREEAAKLSTALRSSGKTAGRWGEEQLQRTLEMGGLRLGVDFRLQTSQADEEGRQKRPDAIISLPGDRELVIDSKCSVQDYLNAVLV
jgi:DNA recombination protein RmuC